MPARSRSRVWHDGVSDLPALKLRPRKVEKPWGRRRLGAGFADVPPGAAPVGELWFEDPRGAGAELPLLVKYLFTSERLSIQVHPDDAAARAKGLGQGKAEAWWVVEAEPDATIGLGLTRTLSRDELRAAALDGRLEELVDWRSVKAGDHFFSPPGTVHAIGPGLALIEVQQNTDVTYRLYDYGRPRELHLDEAVAAARPEPFGEGQPAATLEAGRTLLADRAAFALERWTGAGRTTLAAPEGRPLWLVPLGGAAALDGATLAPGEVWLCEGRVLLERGPDADLLAAYPGGAAAVLG